MNVFEQWKNENKLNPAFQVGELCRKFGLSAKCNGSTYVFTGGDNSPLSKYLLGKTFDLNLNEMLNVPSVKVEEVVEVVEVTEDVDKNKQSQELLDDKLKTNKDK